MKIFHTNSGPLRHFVCEQIPIFSQYQWLKILPRLVDISELWLVLDCLLRCIICFYLYHACCHLIDITLGDYTFKNKAELLCTGNVKTNMHL